VERIGFVQMPKAAEPTRERPRSGGDNRTLTATPSTSPAVIVPTETPTTIAPPPAQPTAPVIDGGSGPLVGGGGPTKGIRPSYTDPRVWMRPDGPAVGPLVPQSPSDQLDTLLALTVRRWQDSVVAANGGRPPGDWTFEKNGKKYGIDQQFIRLGKFSIPTAVLALLPLNVQANPGNIERARTLGWMRQDIMDQAARAEREDEFRAAVKALRERKERERREKAAAQGAGKPPGA
jgi:hypothetical protein